MDLTRFQMSDEDPALSSIASYVVNNVANLPLLFAYGYPEMRRRMGAFRRELLEVVMHPSRLQASTGLEL